MAIVSNPNTFSPNTSISSSQVNANFSTIYNEFNGSISAANLATDAVTTAKIDDDAVTTAKLADSAVTPAKLLTSTGTSWAWQTWTPTTTNLTEGSGTTDAKYTQIGKTIHCYYQFTFAANSSLSAAPILTVPVTSITTIGALPVGQGMLIDANGSSLPVVILLATNGTLIIRKTITDSGTNPVGINISSNITATSPFTWTTNDQILFSATYEAA